LQSELTTEQLRDAIASLEAQRAELLALLEPLCSGNTRLVTKERRERVKAEWTKRSRCAARRVRIVKEIWGVISEEMGNVEGCDLGALKVSEYEGWR
jgi:hypothetical protein